MSNTITADNGVEIAVGVLGLEITDPEVGLAMYARLSPWQRRSLSDALDQGSAVVIGGRLTAPESQFKRERDDLRRQVSDLKERRRKHVEEREAWTRNRRELESERDAAVERAERAERELKPSSPLRQQADAWMRIVQHPAISHTLRETNRSYSDQVFDRVTWLFEAAEDARESSPAVDPVEAKARELATIAYPEPGFDRAFDVADANAKGAYRRLARHFITTKEN